MGTVAGRSTHRALASLRCFALSLQSTKLMVQPCSQGTLASKGQLGIQPTGGAGGREYAHSEDSRVEKSQERQGREQWVPQRSQGASPGHPWGTASSPNTAGNKKGRTSRQPGQEASSRDTRLPAPDDRLLRDLPKIWNHSKVSPLVP